MDGPIGVKPSILVPNLKDIEERIKECNSETNTEITSKDIASNTDPEEASERLADKIAKAVGNIEKAVLK